MTHAQLARRGQLLLLACIFVFVVGMAMNDYRFSVLVTAEHCALFRYSLLLVLGVLALRGARWARNLLALMVATVGLYASRNPLTLP